LFNNSGVQYTTEKLHRNTLKTWSNYLTISN